MDPLAPLSEDIDVELNVHADASDLNAPLVLPAGFKDIPHPGFAHMPLSAVNINHIIGPITGKPILRVIPRYPNTYCGSKYYMATQHRDMTLGKRFIIAGFMPFDTVKGWMRHLYRSGNRGMRAEVSVTNETGLVTVMFCIRDWPPLGFFAPMMPGDVLEGFPGNPGWVKDLTLKELRVVLGKPVKKKEEDEEGV